MVGVRTKQTQQTRWSLFGFHVAFRFEIKSTRSFTKAGSGPAHQDSLSDTWPRFAVADGGGAGSSATWGSDGKLTEVSPENPLKLTPSLNGNTKAGVVPFVYVLLVPTGQQQVKNPNNSTGYYLGR
jgi:hypothetical protein